MCVKSNKFPSGDSLGSMGGRKWSSSSTFTSPYPISLPSALQPWHWQLALQFAAVTSLQLQPCMVTELCTSHPTFHLLSQVPLFPCLQNKLWLNSTINQSLECPVPQYKIKIQFWVNSNSLLWVWFFLLPRSRFFLTCMSLIHTILTWCGIGLSCFHLPKLTLAALAGVAVIFVAVKFAPLDDRAVLVSAATVQRITVLLA